MADLLLCSLFSAFQHTMKPFKFTVALRVTGPGECMADFQHDEQLKAA
jgi:hypothetical protein